MTEPLVAADAPEGPAETGAGGAGKLSARRRVYPHRALSILAPMGTLQRVFCADEYMYNAWLYVLPQMLLVSYADLALVQALTVLLDYGAGRRGGNWQPLLADLLTNPYHGVAYFVVIMNLTVFVRCTTLFREAERRRQRERAGIEDYSLLVQGVPASEPTRELQDFLEKLGGGRVVDLCRVTNPELLPLNRRIICAQELIMHYYERLDAAGARASGRVRRRLLRRVARQRRKIEKAEQRIAEEKARLGRRDALIATFADVGSRDACLRKMTRLCCRPRYRGVLSFPACRAAAPAETLYENLNVPWWRRWGYVALSFLVVLCLSVLAFVAIISLKAVNYDQEQQVRRYLQSQVLYYAIFLLVQLFDVAYMPLLAGFQARERHRTLSAAERSWMLKFYMYKLLNRLTVYYWQSFLRVIRREHRADPDYNFFRIFDYKSAWRLRKNHQGYDALFFTLLNVFLANGLDLAEYLFWLVWTRLMAKTPRQRAEALRLRPQRYATKYVNMLTYLTVVMMFAQLHPVLLAAACPYFAVQQLVVRVLQFRLAGRTPPTDSLSRQFEQLSYVMGYLLCLSVAQSYVAVYARYFIGLTVAYVLWVALLHRRFVTLLVARWLPEVRALADTPEALARADRLAASEAIAGVGHFAERYQMDARDAAVRANEEAIARLRRGLAERGYTGDPPRAPDAQAEASVPLQ